MPQLIDTRPQLPGLRETWKGDCRTEEFVSLEEFIELAALAHQAPDHQLIEGVARALAGLYVHLPFKRARYGANPVDALLALARKLPMPGVDFNQAMLSIFHDLHDPHTTYDLPEPYKSATAFLPFQVAVCHEPGVETEGGQRFIVTKVAPGFACAGFEPGARITHWNGMPFARVVHQLAQRENGANPHACFARAMNNLTVRPLYRLLAPQAPTLTVRFDPPPGKGQPGTELIVDWSVRRVLQGDPRDLRRLLFAPAAPKTPAAGDWEAWRRLPVDYKILSLAHPTAAETVKVGVIRIRSFEYSNDASFVNGFTKLVDWMSQNAPVALLIDVRGNPGGTIQSSERLLQIFTPGTVTPVSFQFLNTALVRDVVSTKEPGRLNEFGLGKDTGALYSRAGQLTTTDEANNIGQRYYGRVALITDALCYSATDIFAAGFQDHRIGPVIGVDGSTGGGGANVWKYNSELAGRKSEEDGREFPPLPNGADMGMSVRQCLRAGRFQGEILEDFGVTPDFRYFQTEADLFNGRQGLYEFAFSQLLRGSGLRRLSADLAVKASQLEDGAGETFWIDFQSVGFQHCELVFNKKTLNVVWEAHAEGFRSGGSFDLDRLMKQMSELELRCYSILPLHSFPFYTSQEADALLDGRKAVHHLVASRKVMRGGPGWVDQAVAEGAEPPRFTYLPLSERRKRLLYFVQGRNSAAAVEALAIGKELMALCPDAELRFVSYGAAAALLREHQVDLLDLGMPDHPEMAAPAIRFPEAWKDFQPLLLVGHEEFELAQLRAQGGPGLPCPCALITNTFWETDDDRWYTAAMGQVQKILLLDDVPPDEFDADWDVQAVGPILRPLRYKGLDRAAMRKKARKAAGLSEEALLVCVFVSPGNRTEFAAPLCQLLTEAFALLEHPAPKHLFWDPAAGIRKGEFFPADFDVMMAACDLAITKGDRSIVLELATLGVATLSVSYGLNSTDDFANKRMSNLTVTYDGLEAQELASEMRKGLEQTRLGNNLLDPDLADLGDGAVAAATHLRDMLAANQAFGVSSIAERVHQVCEEKISPQEYRVWVLGHFPWATDQERELLRSAKAMIEELDDPGATDAARTKAVHKLKELVRPFAS